MNLTYVILGFAILGMGLTVTNPFDLQLIYADNHNLVEPIILQDAKNDYYFNEYGQLTKSSHGIFERLLDYVDHNGNPVYVKSKIYETPTAINYESAQASYSFIKSDCALLGYDGGKITGQHKKTLTHLMKSAVNGTDIWNDETVNQSSCNFQLNGNSIIATKSNFDNATSTGLSYDVKYDFDDFGFVEWTYITQNNDITLTDHKFGFTFICDGVECDNVQVDGQSISTGETKTKDDIKGKALKVGQSEFDPKDEQHGYTWALKKPQQNKFVVDFTNAKRLDVGSELIIDPSFSPNGNIMRVYTGWSPASSSCPSPAPESSNFGTAGIARNDDSSSAGYRCYLSGTEFDLSIIDDSSTILTAVFETDYYDIGSLGLSAPPSCDYRFSTTSHDLSSLSTAQGWTAGTSGTLMVNDSECNTYGTNQQVDLGSVGIAEIQAQLTDEDLFSVWISGANPNTRDGSSEWNLGWDTTDTTLELTYAVITLPEKPTGLASESIPYGINGTWTGCENDGLTDNDCSLITGVSLWNTTETKYAEIPLPESAGQDTEYGSISEALDFSSNEILYHFNTNQTDGTIEDVSGSLNNATAIPSPATEPTATYQVTDTSGSQGLYSGSYTISAEKLTASSVLIGETVSKLDLSIYKLGSPTGNADVGVFDSSANLLFTFGTLDVSTLTGSGAWYSFENSDGYTLSANEYVGIRYTGGDSSNRVIPQHDDVSPPLDGTNSIWSRWNGAWGDFTTIDHSMKLYLLTTLATISLSDGLFDSSVTSFPLNFTSTDTLFESTQNTQVGGFVRLNSTNDFNLLAYNVTGNSSPTEIGFNDTKQYVRYDGTDIASVDNDCNLFSWCFYSFDRNGNTFSFIQNGTLKGTNSSSQDLGTATNDMFFIGGNATEIYDSSLIANLDEYYVNDGTDTTQVLNIAERGLNDMTWLANYGNQTYAECPAGIEETVYCRVQLMNGVGNGTSSDLIYGTSDGLPDAPSITADPDGETQIDILRTAGASNGGDVITHYDLRCEVNETGGWLSTVTNGTIVNFYNYTGLSSGDDLTCQWRDRNGVGYSSWSGNTTGTTFEGTAGIAQINGYGNVGDILNMTVGAQITVASPLPIDVNSWKIYQNNTLVKTVTSTETISSIPSIINATLWYLITDDLPHEYAVVLNVENVTGTVDIIGTGNITTTREYDPDYIAADTPSYNPLNYTVTRSSDQDTITLKVNRQESGGTWQIGCIYQTPTQASLTGGGTWSNASDVGYFLDISDDRANSHYYITCYNSDKLFSVTSFTNSSITLLGIEAFDSIYGSFVGVPVGVFFIVMAAGMANTRTAPMWIVVILGMAGIMSTIGFFTLDTGVWALAIIAGLLGLLVGRKIF